jgi:diguanylate cyclase (GGDEF)-like protein
MQRKNAKSNPEKTQPGELVLSPVQIATWALVCVGFAWAWLLPLEPAEKQMVYAWLAVSAVYLIFFFRWWFPHTKESSWINYLPTISNIAIVTGFYYWIGSVLDIKLIYVAIVAGAGIRLGQRAAAVTAVLIAVVTAGVDLLKSTPSTTIVLSASFNAVVYILIGYLTGSLAETIRRQAAEADRRNRTLTLLLDASTTTASLDLHVILPRLAEKLVMGLPATFCRIGLLDRKSNRLVTFGMYPLSDSAAPQTDQRFPLDDMPWHRRVIAEKQIAVAHRDASAGFGEKEWASLFRDGIQSVCLVPLIFEEQVLGVIAVADRSHRDRAPFDQETRNLLQMLAAQVAVNVNNVQLHQTAQRQAERMTVINQVARAISSTIEMDQLLELIYEQLNRVIETDTYYVALHDAQDSSIDMRIIIDAGERFPSQKIPFGAGLASFVIRNRQPLLIRHLTAEMNSLPTQVILMGQNRLSESWLGVPILVSDHFSGVLVVASYAPYAFDDEDVALLTNIATQAAMALDNARHHAEVEEQARRDSLTGVYSHGFFLQRLDEEVERSRVTRKPVSLIMLDVDYFKSYNDTYGHVIGDRVLRLIAQTVEMHVKATDVVGRWGGEEFGIVLPGSTADQACQIAERIRQTLTTLTPISDAASPIPPPTVSQGIATFPDDVADARELVDVSDRVLYQAKASGRDQVRTAGSTEPKYRIALPVSRRMR